MRGKVAKRLRAEARSKSVGLPNTCHTKQKPVFFRDKHSNKGSKVNTTTVTLKECTRKLYLKLKKEYKNV